MAIARKARPAISSALADSTSHSRSPWWKRSRCAADGAIRHPVEQHGRQQRDVEDVALEVGELGEALRERDGQQEREQDLHARQRDPQLVRGARSSGGRACALASARTRSAQCRQPYVVPRDQGEQGRVEAVQRAAVDAEQAAGVLGTHVALDQRLEQVADRRGERDGEAEQQALGAADPVAVVGAARVPDDQHADGDADPQPLPGLVRRDPRRQLAGAERAAAEVGAGVARRTCRAAP